MITPIYAALLGLMLTGLSANVVKSRREFRTGLGDAGNIEMLRRIRAQANFAEYAPLFVILLGFAEYQGLHTWLLHLFGLIFVVGRSCHAYSLLKAEKYENHKLITMPVWRIAGMVCTLSSVGLLSVIILLQLV